MPTVSKHLLLLLSLAHTSLRMTNVASSFSRTFFNRITSPDKKIADHVRTEALSAARGCCYATARLQRLPFSLQAHHPRTPPTGMVILCNTFDQLNFSIEDFR